MGFWVRLSGRPAGICLNVLIVLPAESAWKTRNYEAELPPTVRKSHPSSFWICLSSRDGGWHFGGILGDFLLLLTTKFFEQFCFLFSFLIFLKSKKEIKPEFSLNLCLRWAGTEFQEGIKIKIMGRNMKLPKILPEQQQHRLCPPQS